MVEETSQALHMKTTTSCWMANSHIMMIGIYNMSYRKKNDEYREKNG